MVALTIIGIIVALVTLLMLIPIGADIDYEDGHFALSAKVSGVLIQILPRPTEVESGKKKKKKEKKPKKEKPKKEKPPKEKKKLNFTKEEILLLVKKVLNRFGRFGKKFKVDRFLLHYIAAGKDPYDTAVNFGYVNAALSSLAPLCAQRFDVKDCEVWTDIDFSQEKKKIDFGLAFSIRIGAIFGLLFGIVFSALGILLRNKLRLIKEKRLAKKSGTDASDLINETEIMQENIQPEERNESNG